MGSKRFHVVFRGQTSGKHCQWKKSRLSLFILDNRKWGPFYLKDDNVKLWVEVIIVTLLYAVATVDVLTANGNDAVNLAKGRYVLVTMKTSSRFDGINKLDRYFSYWQILSLVNTTCDSFYQVKVAGIVNKVYSCYTTHRPSFLCSHKLGSKR